jgi:hypothetical protein
MSSIFASDGPDPLAHLRPHLAKVPAAVFEGRWVTVELQPDLFVPQRFSIGVAVAGANGELLYRLIPDASRFECVYSKAMSAIVREMVASAEATLSRAVRAAKPLEEISFESENLSLSTPWTTSGRSAEQILTRLFNDVVPMGAPREKVQREFVSIDTEQARHLVEQELKKIAGLRYEQIVVDPRHVIPDEIGSGLHVLDFNLRPPKGAGNVLSAVYRTPTIIELNLLRSSRDLSTYGRIRDVKDLALFILTGKREQFEDSEFLHIENLLDEQSWCLERQGFRVITFDEPRMLANGILEWADLK